MVMHQLDGRIRRILADLDEKITRASVPVEGIEIAPRGSDAFSPFANGGEWGLDAEWWDFRFRAIVPEGFRGRVELCARTGREAGWEALNPQFVARVNGRIEQAYDTKHTRMALQAEAKPGEVFDIVLNAYVPPKKPLEAPAVLLITLEDVNEPVRQLAYDIRNPWEAACLLPEGDRDREVVLETLARAIDLLDLREAHSDAFDASIAAARAYLKTELYDKRALLPPEAVAECVGHTHIDVAWLWDLYQTRHKAVRSFSTVLKLMEMYPEYRFMSSQAALYRFVQQDEPELFARIQEAVASGRWEVEGGMWVEADCNLAGGEALARQLLAGQSFFQKYFGKLSRVLWLPDVFGYSAALPQLLKLAGIDYFMTTKISWSEYNLHPYDTFTWKGMDGTEVLSHFSPTRDHTGPGFTDLRNYTTYNAMLSPNQVAGGWKRFQQKGLDDHFLVSYGYGDGGGGSTDWMIENGRRMAVPLPATPVVRQSCARGFFEALEKRVKDDPRLPKWSGELYLEYHRGTYTSIGKNKRNNRKLEIALRECELLASLAQARTGKAYPLEALHAIWEDALTLQFHDILPGSSIKKVYDDSDEMYARMFKEVAALNAASEAALAPRVSGDVAAFNSLARTRDDLFRFDAPEGVTALRDACGNVYPAQRDEGRMVAFVRGLQPMGATPLWYVYGARKDAPVEADERGFDTPYFKGEFDDSMRIRSLVVKSSGRELSRAGEPLNRIVCYENKPHNHDAWDVNIYYDRHGWDIDDVQSVEVISRGPVLTRIRVKYAYMKSTLQQDIVLYKDLPRVDFETECDWREKQTLVKARFPMDLFYNDATYDVQYGNVRRATHKNTSWDAARFEVCAHKWADVGEPGFGASLINDCKYGHSVDENAMALTLIKSSIAPNPEADQEKHVFAYSLMPHEETWREADTPYMAYRFNMPVRALSAGGAGESEGFARVDEENVIVEAVKGAEDGNGYVVRLYECYGKRTRAKLKLGFMPKRVYVCDILEREIEQAEVSGREVSFELHPYEIKSFRVEA